MFKTLHEHDFLAVRIRNTSKIQLVSSKVPGLMLCFPKHVAPTVLFQQYYRWKQMIPASQTRVVLIPILQCGGTQDVTVPVCLAWQGFLRTADQNVSTILTAPLTKLAKIRNVLTPAPVSVAEMQTVSWEIIIPIVFVKMVLLEIHFLVAKSQVSLKWSKRENCCKYLPNFPAERPVEIIEPCNPSPCGRNAQCSQQRGAASCRCIGDYTGNPYIECRPECLVNTECPPTKACINQHCVDPCPGVCAINADCSVTNHAPVCRCLQGYTGDAFTSCQRITTCKLSFIKNNIWNILICFSGHSNRNSWSLQSFTLWRKFNLQHKESSSSLSMCAGILWRSLRCLQTRVHC